MLRLCGERGIVLAGQKKHEPSGLTQQLGLWLLMSVLIGVLVFTVVNYGGGAMLDTCFDHFGIQQQITEKRVQQLQKYVNQRGLKAKDADALNAWVKKNPMTLVEIYRSNILLYSSSVSEDLLEAENQTESPYYDWVSYYQIEFADGSAEVVLYANDIYKWEMFLTIAALLIAFTVFLLVFLHKCRGLVRYICQLSAEVQNMEGGDLEIPITIQSDHELTQLAQSLDSMRIAFREQRGRETQIVTANQKMLTEMSHDLRTPLTTLRIYTDILLYKKYQPEQLEQYLEKIDAKASQIKQLADNIFEYALVSQHQEAKLEAPASFQQVFHDLLSELVAHLETQGYHFGLNLNWPEGKIAAYTPYIKRLLDNISSNIMKYADPVVPILIEVEQVEDCIALSVQNAVKLRLHSSESNQIGLTNIETMMEKMGGSCEVYRTISTFCIELRFPLVEKSDSVETAKKTYRISS